MTNFMRYKGKNELVFSCDNDKNVTIILGDNTFGKTTIAQAFRWGLYGKVKKTNYIKNINDIVLLNNEVIALMDKGDIQKVQVEIVVENGPNTYTFIRSQEFRKVNEDKDDLTVVPFNKTGTSGSVLFSSSSLQAVKILSPHNSIHTNNRFFFIIFFILIVHKNRAKINNPDETNNLKK